MIGNIQRGARDMAYWWLNGQPPVSQELAQARSNICTLCPLNHDPTTFESLVGQAAVAVKKALEMKHKLNLTLENEHSLGICAACGCNLKLKPWTPGSVLFKDGQPDYFDALPLGCWVRSEEDSPI